MHRHTYIKIVYSLSNWHLLCTKIRTKLKYINKLNSRHSLWKLFGFVKYQINSTYSSNTTRVYFKSSCTFTCMLHVSALSQAIVRHVNIKILQRRRYNKVQSKGPFVYSRFPLMLKYTGWSNSLCAPDDLYCNHQVHRKFLITMYNIKYIKYNV